MDFDGTGRPQGKGPDIGAYEYSSSAPPKSGKDDAAPPKR
jgi:hypothetical protein